MKEAELEIVRLTESQLLGALLIDAGYSGTFSQVKMLVIIDDFLPNYRDGLHLRIYEAMFDSDGSTDQVTVANIMNALGTLQAGDIAYMSELIATFVDPLDAVHYAKLVADNAARWRVGGRARPRFTGVV